MLDVYSTCVARPVADWARTVDMGLHYVSFADIAVHRVLGVAKSRHACTEIVGWTLAGTVTIATDGLLHGGGRCRTGGCRWDV